MRFYAKQTGQSFFLKIFLSGGAGNTPGLADYLSKKLNVDTGVFDPFDLENSENNMSISNPSQYTAALGLSIRAGMDNE